MSKALAATFVNARNDGTNWPPDAATSHHGVIRLLKSQDDNYCSPEAATSHHRNVCRLKFKDKYNVVKVPLDAGTALHVAALGSYNMPKKDDDLSKSIASCNMEAGSCINFLEGNWQHKKSFCICDTEPQDRSEGGSLTRGGGYSGIGGHLLPETDETILDQHFELLNFENMTTLTGMEVITTRNSMILLCGSIFLN